MLVVEGGLDPSYVMDEMQMYEIEPLVSNIHKKNKDSWEQTRFLAYILAQVNSTKKLKMTDLLQFSWDEDIEPQTTISDDDITRLRNKAKNYFKKEQNERPSNKINS